LTTSRSEDGLRKIEYVLLKTNGMMGDHEQCLNIISKEMTSSTTDREKRGDVSGIKNK